MQTIKTIGIVIIIILAIDFLGMMLWAMSGQFPVDNFYIGAISRNILQAIFF